MANRTPRTEEQKAHLSRVLTGRKQTIEAIEAMRKGGAGKYERTPELREKMRIASLDHIISEETREKMRVVHTGRKHTAEAKEKNRASATGQVKDEDTRRKISIAQVKSFENNPGRRVLTEKHRKNISDANLGRAPTKGGHTDWYDYIDYSGRLSRVQGTYELRVAQYLDDLGLEWICVNRSEKHSFLLSDNTRYHADFYLPQLDVYLDPKGYWRDQVKYDLVEKEYPEKVKFLVGEDYLEQLKELLQ